MEEGREEQSRDGSTGEASAVQGTGQACILAGVPFCMAAQAGRAGGKNRGLEEDPLHTASSPCAPACPHLTPGLIFLLFTPEKLFQAMAVLAVGFTTQSPGAVSRLCALRCAPWLPSSCYTFLPSGVFLSFLLYLFYLYFLGECKSQKQGP